jgi:PAS domain S-box-containing protein
MDPSALDSQKAGVRVEEVFGTGQPRLLDAAKILPAAYALRCSELATELASFVGVGDEVLERCNLGVPFGETLAACFDAVGSSSTWLYLLHDQDRLQIRTVSDGAGWEHEELRTFFGHEALLRETVASSVITRLPSPAISSAETDDILRRAGARAALIAPLPYLGSARAALLMFARGPAIDLEQWLPLALWSANRITQVFTLASALTEREAAQQKAKEEAALLTALVEHAPDNVFHVDPHGIIRFVNRLPAGCRHDDVVDTHWLTHISPDQHPMLREALQRALTTSETIACEVLGPAADGTAAWYWLRIAAVRRDAEALGAVIIASDLSEKMHTEAQLIVSDRMASVGTLAAGLAHEINNPLASVLANLDMAIRDVAELATRVKVPPELVEELKDARAGGERVRQIARDLKIFSRVENDTRGPVDVERVIDSTLRMAWNEIRTGPG